MRIAVGGTLHIGKTTFVNDFIKEFPMYKLGDKWGEEVKEQFLNSDETYELIETDDAALNEKLIQKANAKKFESIAIQMTDVLMKLKEGENVILDWSPLDLVVKALRLNHKNELSDKSTKNIIDTMRESLVFLDIVFFAPITKHTPISISADMRVLREECDYIYKALMVAYNQNSKKFFPVEHLLGCPAVIEIFGNKEERIQLVKFYIGPDGAPSKEEMQIDKADETELAREAFGLKTAGGIIT